MNTARTQIIATLGPATKDPQMISKLIEAGVEMFRLNFSYGSEQEHLEFINNIRQAALNLNKDIPIIADLSGPRSSEDGQHQFDQSATSVITDKDIKDLEFALKNSVEYVALSFVGEARDILQLKEEMARFNGQVSIIAKIERAVALDNLDEIIKVSDGVMIARGDLGNEVALEKIPFIERSIIKQCNQQSKLVITATQMLLSMVENPAPTRAEVTDVAFAVINGSDGVMLSEETAIGKYPVESVEMMQKIITEAERHLRII